MSSKKNIEEIFLQLSVFGSQYKINRSIFVILPAYGLGC